MMDWDWSGFPRNLQTFKFSIWPMESQRLPLDILLKQVWLHSPNLQNLRVDIEMNRNISTLFENLTELELYWIESEDFSNFYYLMRAVVFASPDLARLILSFQRDDQPQAYLYLDEHVFSWIQTFRRLRALHVGSKYYPIKETKEDRDELADRVWIRKPVNRHLSFLKIWDSFYINYEFLEWLPNLQHLHLVVDSWPHPVDSSQIGGMKLNLRDHIRSGLMYQSEVWELVPKLSRIVLEWEGNRNPYSLEFDRWTYERLKAKGQESSSAGIVFTWREDIYIVSDEPPADSDSDSSFFEEVDDGIDNESPVFDLEVLNYQDQDMDWSSDDSEEGEGEPDWDAASNPDDNNEQDEENND